MKNNPRFLTQGALLIALAVILQSLRLILPLPLPVSTFIIGTLVHTMLTLTVQCNRLSTALLLSCLLPLFAYAQGQLLFPVLIPVVMLGNSLFVVLVHKLQQGWLLLLAPLTKALAMGSTAFIVEQLLQLQQPQLLKTLLFAMTVPQFVTGVAGISLAKQVIKQLDLKLN